jgi:type IV secretory pathway protease TraF
LPSLLRGLYHLEPAAPPIRGAIVSFQPPARAGALIAARAYLPPSASLLKVVVALTGDGVCIDEVTFAVNGRLVGAVASRDSAGRALVPFWFCGAVPEGQALGATRARLSFDSRYFGPVPLASLTFAVPLWTLA